MTPGHDLCLHPAAPADVPEVLRLIRGLAAYERLLHEATVTEADLHVALFGPLPRIHAILAEVDGSPVGLALFYYTFNTFKARPNIFLEDLFVDPAHRGSGDRSGADAPSRAAGAGGKLPPYRMACAELEPARDRLL